MAQSSGHRPQEAQAVLQVPDSRAREGVFVQRVRFKAETLGVGPKFEPDRETGKELKVRF